MQKGEMSVARGQAEQTRTVAKMQKQETRHPPLAHSESHGLNSMRGFRDSDYIEN